ncbi:MAG: hypothetical protein Q9174_002605, partial [Haloplaca sp. 1 TL-2023]
MAHLAAGFPALDPKAVTLYYTKDPLLENLPVLIFYGASTTRNATRSSARIQAHIYSLAGLRSFHNLSIAPTSPLYAAVNHLPSDKQGDETSRGLAIGLLSYFAGLSEPTKDVLKELASRRRPNRMCPVMFDEMHAGELASQMVEAAEPEETFKQLSTALPDQVLSWMDIDVLLPQGTIQRAVSQDGLEVTPAFGEDGLPLFHYGPYTSIVNQIGYPAFLPTSKLRRAPSRPTAHSKSRSLAKDQKIALRREMCELLDTERNYVAKLHEMVDDVAVAFRQSYRTDTQSRSVRLGESPVDQLFPESLTRILAVNDGFMNELEDIMSTTEDEAIQDIEGLAEGLARLQLDQVNTASRKRDPTGTLSFAKTLLKWLPQFLTPYQDYMRSSAHLSTALAAARGDGVSHLSQAINDFGEQRLRSMLIEPVQRLPRYSLLLDNMISQLPASHIALSSLLKSKDLIADICALESATGADNTRASSALRRLVRDWPSWLSPRGRLVAVIDAVELHPPYSNVAAGAESLILLFPDTLITIRKENTDSLNAKGLMVEIDRPSASVLHPSSNDKGLLYSAAFDLSKLRLSESADGRFVRIFHAAAGIPRKEDSLKNFNPADIHLKVLSLLGTYEGKAYRLSQEVAKARIEGRFPESIRESDRWCLQMTDAASGSLGLVAAIHEQGDMEKRSPILSRGKVQVEIGTLVSPRTILSRDSRVEIGAHIKYYEPHSIKLEIEGHGEPQYSGISSIEGLCKLLVSRVTKILRVQGQPAIQLDACLDVSLNLELLRAQSLKRLDDGTGSRTSRPRSPIKLVANLLGGSVGQPDTPSKSSNQTPTIKDVPPIPPPKPINFSTQGQPRQPVEDKVTLLGTGEKEARDPLADLETTFNAYVIALRSRSGNVVGRILRNRAAADELEVNELYNMLLERPPRVQAAAEVSIDVLFAAFEKFLAKAWEERMGAVLTPEILETMASGTGSGRPADFAHNVRTAVEDMSPQNRRAFCSTIKLLSDLLEASGNDSDRGALMASFTEVLIRNGNPHDYIALFDRMVDDYDSIFDESGFVNTDNSDLGSASDSLQRHRSFNTGSLSSNASSLKRRFGFGGLSRENSKSESESKVASVWRTLSKNAKSPSNDQSKPASLSKGSLIRSRSTDTDPRMLPPLRPSSRDKPTPPNASPRETPSSRPTSSHMNMSVLTTIGEGTPTKVPSSFKKKRRSSLSDLKPIQDSAMTSPWPPLQPRRLPQPTVNGVTPPRTPSSRGHSNRQTPSVDYSKRFGSPGRFGSQRLKSPQHLASPPQKENSPSQAGSPKKTGSPSIPRYNYNKPVATDTGEVTIKSFSPKKRVPSSSGTSTARGGGLAERTWPPNSAANTTATNRAETTMAPNKTTQPSSQKLRMQSPQKLRERLSAEQKALSGAESSLQMEIAKIGEEMSAFRLSRPDSRPQSSSSSNNNQQNLSLQTLELRLSALSESLTSLSGDLKGSYDGLKKDVESSLVVSERKARKLDELYSEANVENEMLYERFNDELGKVLKG